MTHENFGPATGEPGSSGADPDDAAGTSGPSPIPPVPHYETPQPTSPWANPNSAESSGLNLASPETDSVTGGFSPTTGGFNPASSAQNPTADWNQS
ncbi:MAG: hypothetical protein LBL92_07490, partial [Propionibacteriaceae bacterium]|nr:hypothetical protein [Propionibacteriaceae bacterium]